MDYVPRETRQICGDISGLRVLNVGCGDMIADIGLLSLGVEHITGLDVLEREWDVIEHAAGEVSKAGFALPADYRSKLSYRTYNGTRFPLPNDSFDLVICWGAFEHIADVPAVLREMKRVIKRDGGRIFAVVHPWYHTFTGSHLTDFIEEPYFHLTRSDDWVYSKLEEYLKNNPDIASQHLGFFGPDGCPMRKFVLEIMWDAYRTLNGYSARMFLADAMEAGLLIDRMHSHLEPLGRTPPRFINPVDIYTAGTTVIFRPAPGESDDAASPKGDAVWKTARDAMRERDIAVAESAAAKAALEAEHRFRQELQASISWRLTGPGRSIVSALLRWSGR